MKKPSRASSGLAASNDDDVRSSLDLLDSVIGEFDDGLLSAAESDIGHQSRVQSRNSENGRIEAEIRKRPPPKAKEVIPNSRRSLTDKIDDIFSELTEEIYTADKAKQIVNRQLSPVRRVNDPLPTPPAQIPRKTSSSSSNPSKDEVVVYVEKERPKEVIPLKKSVKAQIHSLEARGRHHRVITTSNEKSTFAKNSSRSRSENPPPDRLSAPNKSEIGDDFASRVNPDKLNQRKSHVPPPPMPEKTKIHLKNDSSSLNSKKKTSSSPTGKKVNKAILDKRRPDQPLPEIPSNSDQLSSLQSSQHPYEVLPELSSSAKKEQYRRSRSLGPVVEAAQRELLASAAKARERSRSRGGPMEGESNLARSKSKSRYDEESPRHFTKSSLESGHSRGRSKTKANVERSVSTSKQKPLSVDVMDPFMPPMRMPARQKSMIDLRDPGPVWDQPPHPTRILPNLHHSHQRQETPQGRHFPGFPGLAHGSPQNLHASHSNVNSNRGRPPMMRSATEHDIKIRNRRSMAVGPFEDLPHHIRQHMARQHGFPIDASSGFLPGRRPHPGNHLNPRDRQILEEDSILMRHLTLEAQREFLMRRGFSPSHPYISGEVPIHPELQGRLPFNVPSRTIPLRPDDYQRFKPEYWLQSHNPNPVAFNDLAVLHNELELRRRREIHRQNSHRQQQLLHPGATNGNVENNFNSLPWEEIIPRRMGGIPVFPPENIEITTSNSRKDSSGKKSSNKKSGWFNPGQVWKETEPEVRGNVKQQGHWLLRERETPGLLSMPPNIDTLRDSGIGLNPDDGTPFSRSEPKRSSFGMALKDKFNKNPNMYFPGPDKSLDSRSSGSKSRSGSTSSPIATKTSLDDEPVVSDTDTLIHNMSDGSYEKEDNDSFGSAKGSRSSGNSSLSPHNSMEGSPRMINSVTPQFQLVASTNPSVSLGKKTIRNYTPKESSNMLREFEDRRNNSKPRSKKPSVERKSSMERMIDDFHRSLPPPLSEGRQQDSNVSHQDSTMTTTATITSSNKRPSKNGTMNSQVSNWSVASSTASFDYQPANNGLKRGKSSDLPSVDEDLEPHGERVPPDGSSSSSGVSPTNFVQRIEIKQNSPKPARKAAERRKSTKEEAPLPPPPPLPPQDPEESDDFSNLRRLISEGRIAGLDAKPPSFTPPSPPANNSRRPSSAKPSASITPKTTPKATHSAERQPSRKSREAPKPPMNNGARQREPSLEDLTQMTQKKRSEVKRSSSNHGSRPSGFDNHFDDTTTAQLIADSTERKFNFNPFKGKLFKKKQYSFDFH